jgi:hypothetical protein
LLRIASRLQTGGSIHPSKLDVVTAAPEFANEQCAVVFRIFHDKNANGGTHLSSPGWRLVEDQPIQAELVGHIDEMLKVDGLADITISADDITLEAILRFA